MSNFVPKKVYLRGILLKYFIQKKSAAEAHGILIETYGDHVLSEATCRDWLRCFKNNDFDFEDKELSGALRTVDNEELEALPHEDSSQAPAELAESLEVDHTTVLKRLKRFKSKDIERCTRWSRKTSCYVWTAVSTAEN